MFLRHFERGFRFFPCKLVLKEWLRCESEFVHVFKMSPPCEEDTLISHLGKGTGATGEGTCVRICSLRSHVYST